MRPGRSSRHAGDSLGRAWGYGCVEPAEQVLGCSRVSPHLPHQEPNQRFQVSLKPSRMKRFSLRGKDDLLRLDFPIKHQARP